MVRYHQALNSKGELIHARDLAGQVVTDSFVCLGCGNQLIARVNGEYRQPHFAHKQYVECNEETYLHRLGKRVFEDTYKKCLENGEPFLINLQAPIKCQKFKPLIMVECELGEQIKEFDLTQYYGEILVEKKDNEFIPDLCLVSKNHPNKNIYIEIAVTHFLSEKKEKSKNRIIEIPIDSEEDIEKIKQAKISEDNSSFYGFDVSISNLPDSHCKCRNKKYFGFYVYKTGKAFIEYTELKSIYSKFIRFKDDIIYGNIFPSRNKFEYAINTFEIGTLFVEQVVQAKNNNIPIKNCFICKYHGINQNPVSKGKIFCKTYKKSCTSNEAVTCDRYRVSQEYLEY